MHLLSLLIAQSQAERHHFAFDSPSRYNLCRDGGNYARTGRSQYNGPKDSAVLTWSFETNNKATIKAGIVMDSAGCTCECCSVQPSRFVVAGHPQKRGAPLEPVQGRAYTIVTVSIRERTCLPYPCPAAAVVGDQSGYVYKVGPLGSLLWSVQPTNARVWGLSLTSDSATLVVSGGSLVVTYNANAATAPTPSSSLDLTYDGFGSPAITSDSLSAYVAIKGGPSANRGAVARVTLAGSLTWTFLGGNGDPPLGTGVTRDSADNVYFGK